MFDLVQPLATDGWFGLERGQLGLDEAGHPGTTLRNHKLTYVNDDAHDPIYPAVMLDEEFKKERANLLRHLAGHADPFTKRRLMELIGLLWVLRNCRAAFAPSTSKRSSGLENFLIRPRS